MNFTVRLQPAMSFHIVWLITGLLLLAGAAALFLLLRKLAPAARKRKSVVPVASGPGFYALKREYIAKIQKLSAKRAKGRISLRDAYQDLSTLARGYIQQTTGKNVLKMSLSELRSIEREVPNIKRLTGLVTEYYEPEFARWSDADFQKSCDETRRMIEQWL